MVTSDVEFQLRLTLYDTANRCFFGSTWLGPYFPGSVKENGRHTVIWDEVGMQGSFQIIILYVSERRLLQGQKASKNCSLTQYTEIVQRLAVIGPMQGRKKNRVGIKPRTFGGTEYGSVLYSLIDYSINFPCQRASFIDISLQ